MGRDDIGRRVSVRRRVEGGLTDVVGHLLDVTDTSLTVLRASGETVVMDTSAVTASKTVPAAPVRRGWQVPTLSPAEMQRLCSAGWPAREVEPVGEWLLRKHDGITGRANSVMAVGGPGRPIREALELARDWYTARSLPPLLQVPLVDPATTAIAAAGWHRVHVTLVQVAPAEQVLASIPPLPGHLSADMAPAPSPDWRSLMHDLDEADPASHLAILTAPPVVGFATLLQGGDPVAIGRVSVEGSWAGITSVDVAPGHRRKGLGTAVMRALLEWAAAQGAPWSYLQVRAGNEAALRLYAGLGYVTHHPYAYWTTGPR